MNRSASIDALRGIAVIAVIGHHYWWEAIFDNRFLSHVFLPGFLGVQLFFGVSGYLLAGQLMDAPRSGALTVFYARRIARIVPLYLCLLAVAALAGAVVSWPFLTMTQNISFALAGWPGAASTNPQNWLSPTWSLAVEEQFYLLLPWMIYLIPRERLIWVLIPAIVGSFGLREWMMAQGHVVESFVLTPTNAAALFSGVAAAWLVRYRGWKLPSIPCGPVLGWIGRRSYALYLFHLPTAALAIRLGGGPLLAAGLLAVAAQLAYIVIERPVLDAARARWRYGHASQAVQVIA